MPFSPGKTQDLPESEPSAWQARALDRSLSDVRAQSMERLSQFVAAARALAEQTGTSTFTVQQVVADSGQSLKTFYRYFAGKDDLLVALLEEDVAVGALFLRALIDEHDDPADRIREWVVGLFGLMSSGDQGYVAVLVREHQRLTETRPQEMEVAIGPFLALLVDELVRGQAAGVVREGDAHRDARLVFQLCLASILEMVRARDLRDSSVVADDLWEFCWGGLHGGGAGTC
jgi:AcrR family transcriptional regulator